MFKYVAELQDENRASISVAFSLGIWEVRMLLWTQFYRRLQVQLIMSRIDDTES